MSQTIENEPTTNGFSYSAAIKMLRQVGPRFCTAHHTGTYNPADPTHFERWKMAVAMDSGFGPPIEVEGEGKYPPGSEVVIVKWNDVTWGTTIEIIGDNINLNGYWDHNCGSSNPPSWATIHDVANKVSSSGPELVNKIHDTIVRLLLEGDWGNDKPIWLQEDEEPHIHGSEA